MIDPRPLALRRTWVSCRSVERRLISDVEGPDCTFVGALETLNKCNDSCFSALAEIDAIAVLQTVDDPWFLARAEIDPVTFWSVVVVPEAASSRISAIMLAQSCIICTRCSQY